MKLTVVGCTGSLPGPSSPASCYLVESGDTRLLLDLGSGALGPLQRLLDPAELDAVLLTHLHPDHWLDLCALYVWLNYRPGPRRAHRLPVYGPTGTAERLAHAYGEHEPGTMARTFDVHEWQPGVAVRFGEVTVTPYPVNHPVPAFGLRLTTPDEQVLAYSGDTDTCDALVELARRADLLLCEAAYLEGRDDASRGVHLTGRRAAEVAHRAEVRRLLLTHLPPWTDAETVLAEARPVYTGPVEVAVPGQVVSLLP